MSAAPSQSLKGAAVRGSLWTLGAYGIGQVLRFASSALFSYLLYKEAFAMMMIVNGILQGLQMFSDIGIGPSVVQHRDGEQRRFLATAFTMQVLRGFVLAVLCLALTWPTVAFFAAGNPQADELFRLLPVAALTLGLGGFASTRIHVHSRQLRLGPITVLELGSQIAGIAATVAWAVLYRDVFALVFGGVVSQVTRVLASHLCLRGERDRLGFDRAAAAAIFRFGGWIFVSTIAAFFALQLDRFVFPKQFDWGDAGVYSIAVNLTTVVPAVVGSLQLAVVFPLYSRVLGEGREVGPYVVQVKRAVYALAGLLVACTIGGADALIRLVYADAFAAAGGMVAVLSIGAWFQIVETLYGAVLLARGQTRWVALANASKPVVFLLWLSLAPQPITMTSAILVWSIADLVRGSVAVAGAAHLRAATIALDVRMTTYTFVVAAVLWLGARELRALSFGPLAELLLVGAVGVTLFAPLLLPALATLRSRREVMA